MHRDEHPSHPPFTGVKLQILTQIHIHKDALRLLYALVTGKLLGTRTNTKHTHTRIHTEEIDTRVEPQMHNDFVTFSREFQIPAMASLN